MAVTHIHICVRIHSKPPSGPDDIFCVQHSTCVLINHYVFTFAQQPLTEKPVQLPVVAYAHSALFEPLAGWLTGLIDSSRSNRMTS